MDPRITSASDVVEFLLSTRSREAPPKTSGLRRLDRSMTFGDGKKRPRSPGSFAGEIRGGSGVKGKGPLVCDVLQSPGDVTFGDLESVPLALGRPSPLDGPALSDSSIAIPSSAVSTIFLRISTSPSCLPADRPVVTLGVLAAPTPGCGCW
jgi:hypothetical protein